MTLRIFIGMDRRQPIAYNVLQQSIHRHASKAVQVQPLLLPQLEKHFGRKLRTGLTDFSYTRYLVPALCDYEGWALFMDADMLVRADINELLDYTGDDLALKVVKNEQRFEWPSLMLFNNAKCKQLTPDYIDSANPYKLNWADTIGDLPPEWNHCVGYDKKNPNAKLVHFTMGIPCWPETKGCEFSDEWHQELRLMNSSVSFQELMGKSRHNVEQLRA